MRATSARGASFCARPPLALERRFERVPCERCALDPNWKFLDARKCLQRGQFFRPLDMPAFLGDHFVESPEQFMRLVDRSPLDSLGHEGGGGRGNRAARALEADVLYFAATDLQMHVNFVAAQRVKALGMVR